MTDSATTFSDIQNAEQMHALLQAVSHRRGMLQGELMSLQRKYAATLGALSEAVRAFQTGVERKKGDQFRDAAARSQATRVALAKQSPAAFANYSKTAEAFVRKQMRGGGARRDGQSRLALIHEQTRLLGKPLPFVRTAEEHSRAYDPNGPDAA